MPGSGESRTFPPAKQADRNSSPRQSMVIVSAADSISNTEEVKNYYGQKTERAEITN